MNERMKFKFSVKSHEQKIFETIEKRRRGFITALEMSERIHDEIDEIVKITSNKFFKLGMKQLNIFSIQEHEQIK